MKKIEIFDSTLRDGMQAEGISFTLEDKIKILKALDSLGIAYVEAGFPASNRKDREFIKAAEQVPLKHTKLCAFGSTRHKETLVSEDKPLDMLLQSNVETVTVFGKCWDLHVHEVLQTTPRENLDMIYDTVRFLKEHHRKVIFDAEHFFDGYLSDEKFALSAVKSAVDAGADVICLCDTNGGRYPTEIYSGVKRVVELFPHVQVGIHCHNDMGLAVINSMVAVDAGATQVQGTLIGFGERCGNANLSTIIPNLQLKRGYECIPPEKMGMLAKVARQIAGIANISLSLSKPYVGYSAFAHKGGMHIAAVSKNTRTFEHIDPAVVGNSRRFLVSEVSGRAYVYEKIRAVAPDVKKDSAMAQKIVKKLKEMEYNGYSFEAAEESFELIIRRMLGEYDKFFELEYFKTIDEQSLLDGTNPCCAVIKVKVNDSFETTAAEGDGPVHALDLALRKALVRFYPCLNEMSLVDFKVRVLESDATTAATVRVLIESTDGERRWNTVGVSSDIIEASFLALSDSIEYKLLQEKHKTGSLQREADNTDR